LDHQGNGIGLYIVKSIINRLGGRIEIASNLGEGTRVKLYFPDYNPMDK
jgi:signal transduction histidine kinase